MAVGESDTQPEQIAAGSNEQTAETPAPIVEGSYEWLAKLVLKDDCDISVEFEPADSNVVAAQGSNEESLDVTSSELSDGTTAPRDTKSEGDNDSNVESKEEEEAQKQAAQTLLHDLQVRQVFKSKLRLQNQRAASVRPDEREIAKLDSSLKRNSTFVRKLRTFSCAQLEGLLRDMSSLNLSKYLTEVAAAIVEAKLKVTDVGAAVVMCSLLHQTYAEFSPALWDNWQKILNLKRDEKIANPSKLRVDLRFYGDLVSVSVFQPREALSLLGHVLSSLVMADKEEHHNASIILSFCRHCGDDYAGLVPTVVREAAALLGVKVPRSSLLLAEKQKAVRTLLTDYYASLCKHLLKEHEDLRAVEQQNRRILQTKGELSAERRERLENMHQQYSKLQASVQSFADVLDQPLPEFPEEPATKAEDDCLFGVSLPGVSGDGEGGPGGGQCLWEDEETQRFYEDLPNIQEYIPGRSKDNKDIAPPAKTEPVSQVTEEELDAELREEDLEDEGEPALPEEEIEEPETEPVGSSSTTTKQQLEAFLAHLPQCVNCELIDNAAAEFVISLNAKSNKKKLVRVLFGVPRTRIDLLPFYARLVATLHPVFPEVSQDLCTMLKHDFKYHIRKKDQINIESKLKVVRFIGELVKFGMYPLMDGLYCLKVLLHDFTHHHVDMACALLETCGRYFLRQPLSHQRTKIYLEQMMRKKSALAMDSRYVTMIENAFFFVNPPEGSTVKIKERPPLHIFIRKLLYQDLSKPTTDKVLRLMRRLNWEDKDLSYYAIKCLTAAWNVKYYNIRCLASLVAGLVEYQEFVGSMVVDGVLEDIRVGMELNLPKLNQRRVAMMKYLGELYNYRVVESGDVFKVLYSLIKFGVSFDLANPSPLDPPDHLFRLRLVCTLLATCGQFFVNGPSRQRLDYFIIYFEHYYWFKRESAVWCSTDQLNALTGGGDAEPVFPISMEYLFRDTILALRPNLTLCANLEEATAALTKLESTLISQLPTFNPARNDNSELSTIAEDSEKETDTEKDATDLSSYEEDNEADSDDDIDDDEDDGEEGVDDDDEEDSESPLKADLVDSADVVRIRRQDQEKVCEEDKEFLEELDRMVTGNLQDRARATAKPQQVDIAIPLHVRASHKKTYEQLQEPSEQQSDDTVNFVLLTRRGNKQSYRSLAVPVSSELALNLKNQEQAERVEMERMKKLTLDINERLEEEDYQDMLASQQRPTTVNLNRERRNRYQHPKGAPDADLIFGPKKVR